MKNPKPNFEELITRIRTTTDKAKRSYLKNKLVAFTPCAFVKSGTRKYANITGFTQVMSFDFDGLPDKEYAEDFKESLFNSYNYIFACWVSASGKGVRGLVRIPKVKDVDEFKSRFNALANELSVYKGWDNAPKNCILPLFYSIDRNMLIRLRPDKFDEILVQKKHVSAINFADTYYTNNSEYHFQKVVKITRSGIDKIKDNGHPQLRGVAVALGGYVGGGYISEVEAINLIDTLIVTNNYLSIKPEVYKKTARQMITYGSQRPLTL